MPGSLMVQFNDWSWTLRTVGEKNGDSDGGVVRESQKYQQTYFLEAGASHRLVSKQEPESCCHLCPAGEGISPAIWFKFGPSPVARHGLWWFII